MEFKGLRISSRSKYQLWKRWRCRNESLYLSYEGICYANQIASCWSGRGEEDSFLFVCSFSYAAFDMPKITMTSKILMRMWAYEFIVLKQGWKIVKFNNGYFCFNGRKWSFLTHWHKRKNPVYYLNCIFIFQGCSRLVVKLGALH